MQLILKLIYAETKVNSSFSLFVYLNKEVIVDRSFLLSGKIN